MYQAHKGRPHVQLFAEDKCALQHIPQLCSHHGSTSDGQVG